MNRLVLAIVLALSAGTGCIVHKYDDYGGSYEPPSSSSPGDVPRGCSAHAECKVGCYCDEGSHLCRTSDVCTEDSDCHGGFRCDHRGTCVPREDGPADAGAPDAGHGGCSWGACVARDGGTRAPDAPPQAGSCGPGGCPGRDAGTCAEAGGCTPRCRFDQQCGQGGRCLEGRCERPCGATAGCGTGAVCRDGYCQPDDRPGG